jgi:hypothetical protein
LLGILPGTRNEADAVRRSTWSSRYLLSSQVCSTLVVLHLIFSACHHYNKLRRCHCSLDRWTKARVVGLGSLTEGVKADKSLH